MTIKRRIKLIQHEYNQMTRVALNETISYDEKMSRITQHSLNIEKYQNELFYNE
jgi:hypothetical protein